jgi:hypothetical protein
MSAVLRSCRESGVVILPMSARLPGVRSFGHDSSGGALRAELRDLLAPVARGHGYKGSAPTWRKSSTTGDWAVVNVQSSPWSRSQSLRCVVNLAFAPEPWLRWEREHLAAGMPKSVTESLGLYRERLHPAGTPERTDGWWELSDVVSARAAVADMMVQLDRSGWPVLEACSRARQCLAGSAMEISAI